MGFHKNPIGLTLIVLMVCGFAIYFWIKFFDTKDKLIIDKEGIWSANSGMIQWQNIWYLFFKETRGRWQRHELIIRLRDTDTEYTIDFTALNQTEQNILEALQDNSQGFAVQFLEKEIVK